MSAILEDGKLRLTGYVGDYYYEDGFTSSDVVMCLAEVTDDSLLDVYLNSYGGIATEGAAIHAILSARAGITNIVIEGIAASAASLIAMAGATITMSAGSVMMIHDPAGFTWGNSDDHAKTIEGLEALGNSYARVYAAKSGKTPDECRAIMKEERWFTPEQAVEAGFADATTEASAEPVAAFDYRVFTHAPQQLVALATEKNWSLPVASKAAPPRPHRQPQEVTMTTAPNPAALTTADIDKARSEATDAANKATATVAADIIELCNSAGVPAMAAALIREGVTLEVAKTRTSNAKDIRAAVDTAKKSYPKITADADAFIAAGMTMDQVRADLFTKITAAQSPEITTGHQAETGGDEAATLAAKIVAIHRGPVNTSQRSAS
jgi:ATP-dependent Clp protease protease subunit